MGELEPTLIYTDPSPMYVRYVKTFIAQSHKHPVYWIFNCKSYVDAEYRAPTQTIGKQNKLQLVPFFFQW